MFVFFQEIFQNSYKDFIASIFKTIVMFTGELEYSNLPIHFNVSNLENHVHYERTGVILTFLYLLPFIFIAIIVLMNLLNAIAIN